MIGSSKSKCKLFFCNAQQIGWIREDAATQLRRYPDVFIEHSNQYIAKRKFSQIFRNKIVICRFVLSDHLNNYENRSEAIAKVLNDMRARDCLRTLRGWRDEVNIDHTVLTES